MNGTKKYDVIIVGAGSMGVAAAHFLAKEGKSVVMIDAFNPPHDYGSHAGETRIVRHACGEGFLYCQLALRSQEFWDEMQAHTQENLYRKTGVLSFGDRNSAFANTAIEGAEKFEIDVETFKSGKEIEKRFPTITVPPETIGTYEPNAGVLYADRIIRHWKKSAVGYGAQLVINSPVNEIDLISDHEVKVHSQKGTFKGEKLMLTAGAWMPNILRKLGVDIHLTASRRTVSWFDINEIKFGADAFPGFFYDGPEGEFYGFPSLDGTGVKIGRYDVPRDIDAAYVNREFGVFKDDVEDVRAWLEEFMPQAANRLREGKVCMFVNTPDEDFIVDYLPNHKNVVVGAGFSGHGFKHSAAIGELLSQLAMDQKPWLDISQLSIQRPTLQK